MSVKNKKNVVIQKSQEFFSFRLINFYIDIMIMDNGYNKYIYIYWYLDISLGFSLSRNSGDGVFS